MSPGNKRSGFTLMELLVSSVIMGLLAVMAVPQYNQYRMRAQQTQAKAELSAIHGFESAFHANYNTYHGHLPLVGFVPEGYPSSSGNYSYPKTGTSNVYYSIRSFNTCTDMDDSTAAPLTPTSLGVTVGSMDYMGSFQNSSRYCSSDSSNCGHIYENYSTSKDSYSIEAMGCVGPNPTISNTCDYKNKMDRWTINEQGVLKPYTPSIPGC